ncbi:hypothetical protein M406DRAFT_277856 [Cryphonectria parasitica EP155]|uniref:Uncharacterized protein n=1 Tax=Cryphonectria parasitica (strain ATCC 38755 / EP155) TaxID=660469 RepID=A0A9P4XZT0_CRYP1|nr:uncharacterized protein M406DRAFT_277856 [Cryphonectria parasitica EP155]KAF3764364.1 hypothetical protein M406DRAFT_277856 [Cryphonectria parasitica EP155]
MEMDLEQSPSPRSEQTTVKGRTPLPRGPRLTGPQAALPSLNSPERPRPDLPGLAPRTYTIPDCGRYSAVEALLLFWTDDRHSELRAVVDGLQQVLSEQYNSACVVQSIPSSATPAHLYRWLSDQIRNFARHNDQRDVLKIVYYNGHAYLNRNRDMVLASSPRPNEATEIRWKPIQADLEESSTDTLIIMDCPYFGDKLSSSRGILEVLASNTYDDYVRCPIPRCAFTKALTEKLQTHASQGSPRTPLCATDLHAHLMSEYPKIIRDTRSDDEALQNFPSPSHVLVRARDTMAASIELIPRRRGSSPPRSLEPGRQLNISLRIGGDADLETLVDFFRLKPDAVRQVQIEDRTPLSALN